MHIGISITPFGHHPAAWRENGSPDTMDFKHLAAQVKKAEDGKCSISPFLRTGWADGQSMICLRRQCLSNRRLWSRRLPPSRAKSALSRLPATSQHEPYNLARRFASLDTISKGRAGWNLVISPETVAREEEYIDVVSGLWDSWGDDAFVYDKASGRFFVPGKMHVLNHAGAHFTVRGPLNVNRSPQGKPLISHLLTRDTLDIAARSAELIFIGARSPDEARALVADITQRLGRHARMRSDVRILANVVPYIAGTAARHGKSVTGSMRCPPLGKSPPGLKSLARPLEQRINCRTGLRRSGLTGS